MIYRISRNVPEFYTIVSVGVDVCTCIYIPMRENGWTNYREIRLPEYTILPIIISQTTC